MRAILLLSVLLTLAACLPDHEQERKLSARDRDEDKPVRVGLVLGRYGLGDQSFNDMQYNGLIAAYRRFSIKAVFRVVKDETEAGMQPVFEELIHRERCNVVIAGEAYLMSGLVIKLAKKYPDVMFVMMDYRLDSVPNVVSVEFAQNEGSYAAGFLAARVSGKTRIGFLGGVDLPVIKDFATGFREGVAAGNPAATVIEEYLTRLPDFSGFSDPKKGHAAALKMYADGIDVVYAVAGASGNGVIHAASETGKYVIGVDSNQDHMAPGRVLTSMMKRLDVAVLRLIEARIAGTLKGGVYRSDYRDGGISLTEMEYSRDRIPADLIRELRELEKKIADRRIAVGSYLKG